MMNQRSLIVGAVLIGAVVVVGGMVWSAEKDKLKGHRGEDRRDVIAMATTAKITIDQAIKTALENFPGKVIDAELENQHNKAVWDIEILTANQGIMVVQVDAVSGSVISTEEKVAEETQEPEKKQ